MDFQHVHHRNTLTSGVALDAVLSFVTHSKSRKIPFEPLKSIRRHLNDLQVRDVTFAHRLCQLIPSQCPFERDVKVFGRTLLHIPPMCKFNPLYEELIGLRFRALCYLADECGEDISRYC